MPSQKYVKSNVFKYSPTPVVDPQYQTLSPAVSDSHTLKDINRDNSQIYINGVTMTELRMNDNNFSEAQRKLYFLNSSEIDRTEINELRPLLSDDKKNIPDAEVKSALKDSIDELRATVNFNTLKEYQEFLKKHLLSNVQDPVKKDFLAETLAQNAHQSGFYKAGNCYLTKKLSTLSRACSESRGNGFRSELLSDNRSELMGNEVCVERYEGNVLHYRAKNAIGEESTGTVELGTGENQLNKEHMAFLTDPVRRFEGKNNRPKVSYISEEGTLEGRAALQALFNITSARGHTQSMESRIAMQSEESYVLRTNNETKVNLTCNKDTVTIDEAGTYNEIVEINRRTGGCETISFDKGYATMNSKIHISAIRPESNQDNRDAKYEIQLKNEGLAMESRTDIPYIRKYFDTAFSESSLTPLQEIENILLAPPPSANEETRKVFFRALTEVGQYQKGRLSANELAVCLDALKPDIQKHEKRQSFIKRHSIIGKKSETALDCLNNAIEKAKKLPDYISPEKVTDVRAAKENAAVANTESVVKLHIGR